MSLALFFIFIIVPIIEIYLFIEIGGFIGGGLTVLLIVTTAVIGVGLARYQGMGLLLQARQDMAQGKPPVGVLGHGAMLLLSGALLITPGFFTDSLGFLLLVPAIRRFLAEVVLGSLVPMEVFSRFSGFKTPSSGPYSKDIEGDVIETAFEVHEADPPQSPHMPKNPNTKGRS